MATPINATVLKAFDALDLFSPDRREITADIVASELEMSRATAYRFLVTLEASGILMSVRRGGYALGPRLMRLGRTVEDLAPVQPRVLETLDALRREVGESVMACRFAPRGPICVAVSEAQQPISVNIRVGTQLPMLKTAQGRLWLAAMSPAERTRWASGQGVAAGALSELGDELVRIRSEGHACNLGDNEPDIGAVSVPVLEDDHIALTLSVFGMLSRFDKDMMLRTERLLKQAAARLAT